MYDPSGGLYKARTCLSLKIKQTVDNYPSGGYTRRAPCLTEPGQPTLHPGAAVAAHALHSLWQLP